MIYLAFGLLWAVATGLFLWLWAVAVRPEGRA